MKLSYSALALASILSSAESKCTDASITSINSHSIEINGYKIEEIKRTERTSMGDNEIEFSKYGKQPVITDGVISAGEDCGIDKDDSAAMAALGVSSYIMGYPAISAGALVMGLLPFATADSECEAPSITVAIDVDPVKKPMSGVNACDGKKVPLDNLDCVDAAVKEQAGANVTVGYVGDYVTDATPITDPYFKKGLCPVNVHWHLGAEHLSVGQYDESGTGPSEIHRRRLAAGKARKGFQCTMYDDKDPKFTKKYDWAHCDKTMEVGQTYEVHWPHSDMGACGTPNQYQTPFYDGVFCNSALLKETVSQIGVQAQVFTIVNDEEYYYPDLFRGMIVDGEMGKHITKYSGSTTGTSRDNKICSGYSPITWQVDRNCHLISASTFDKMCADMKAQRDDMSDDLYAHGSRELVDDSIAANNQVP